MRQTDRQTDRDRETERDREREREGEMCEPVRHAMCLLLFLFLKKWSCCENLKEHESPMFLLDRQHPFC